MSSCNLLINTLQWYTIGTCCYPQHLTFISFYTTEQLGAMYCTGAYIDSLIVLRFKLTIFQSTVQHLQHWATTSQILHNYLSWMAWTNPCWNCWCSHMCLTDPYPNPASAHPFLMFCFCLSYLYLLSCVFLQSPCFLLPGFVLYFMFRLLVSLYPVLYFCCLVISQGPYRWKFLV